MGGFFGKNSKSVEFRRTLLLRDASIEVFEGYWVQLVPRLPPFITVISPSLGARGEGILDGGGRVERVSGFRDRRKSKHESGITFTSSEFLLPFTQTVSLSI